VSCRMLDDRYNEESHSVTYGSTTTSLPVTFTPQIERKTELEATRNSEPVLLRLVEELLGLSQVTSS
jgi:hypothetical protein